MAMKFGTVVGVVLAMGLAGTVVAQHQTLHVNPARSNAKFSIKGANPGISGTLQVGKSEVEFDKTGPKIGGSVILLAASEKSGDRARDKAIQTQVLEAPRFAEILFSPTNFTGTLDSSNGKSVLRVTGTLTLHGEQHPVTVPVEVITNGNETTVKVHLEVPTAQWGLQGASGLNIQAGPVVEVDLVLVGFLTPVN